ncbi:efflux RND transporter permease subunit [Oleiagrimonas sp. C23AA]|uniref:efflux RND transporter permease subunit n=1 Tax=Oleiagrimonas sp. C23AA TaxID=2719047 RepID=UPI001420AA81|nr:efflux RND transporter permease subunit [Oleiagrimonas sp. C23AA]NII11183.1 efflux RND transporter permease subunit [Oleiagrimonas sp. C23AA]
MSGLDDFRKLIKRPLLWAMVYGALLSYGVYALLHMPSEVLPSFDFPQISIITHQPGTTAQELESLVARPIEGQILALPHLVSVRSTIGHGTVETDVRFASDTHAQLDLQAVNGAIDRARGQLPSSAHPYAEIMGNAINEVADYTAYIPDDIAPAQVQRTIRASIEPALRALPGVQRVEVYGSGDESLWVQPDLIAMHRHGVSTSAMTRALRQRVLLGPVGYIRQGHQKVLIEARDLPTTVRQLRNVPVPSASGPIPLHALARIVKTAQPVQNAVSLDGRPSVAITVFKQPGASTLPVTRAVQKTLDGTQAQLPHGVRWVRTYNQGHMVHLIGTDLGRNLLIGGVLAVLVLLGVLGAGRGIWMLAFSIPLSLLLAIAALYATGHTLNLMTLGALTVAVGLLADDAIIVLEAIYHRWEQGDLHWVGIRKGLQDIASPDISGSVTTVSVFLPLLFVGGLAGLFFIPFALAMTLAIIASLLVSLTLIPLGLGFIRAHPRQRPTWGARQMDRLRVHNERLFGWVKRHPRWSLTGCVTLFVLSIAGLALVSVNFLPLPNEGVMLESFTLPPGTSLHETQAVIDALTRRLRKDPDVAHTFARIGSASNTAYTEPGYAGEIQIVLKKGIGVDSLNAIGKRLLRESRTQSVQTAIDTPTIERLGESLSGLPQPFVIHVFGTHIRKLKSIADRIVRKLKRSHRFSDIFNNDGYPITQLRILPNHAALAAYGMTSGQLYSQLKPLLGGETVAQVPDGNVPLNLYVRLLQAPDLSVNTLRQLPIHARHWTELGQLAHLKLVSTPNQLRHIDGARALDILATPSFGLTGAGSATSKALQGIKLPPGYRISTGGLYQELIHAAVGVGVAALAALVLMLGILILQFDGLLVPGLLLLQIPLAFTGGALALIVSGVGLNATGLVAFLTLVGLSLNHGIVLLFRARRNEAAGMNPAQAIDEAVHTRFRPILLTTLTAVLGMLPTAIGWGQGAAPEQGLAIVIMGGIIWSALLTTNLIPALYLHRRQRQERTA